MFGLEIVAILLVVSVLSAIQRSKRKRAVHHDLNRWAEDLGMVRVGDELFGELLGVPVGARLAFDSPHGAKVPARWTLYARVQPPLDLGLLIANRSIPVELPGAGTRPALAKVASFNARFSMRCDEPERGAALVTPALSAALERSLHPSAMFMLTDSGVAVQALHGDIDEPKLRAGLRAVAAIADTLNAARDHVPAAFALAGHGAAWRRFSADNGLSHIAAPLCMFGSIEDATVYAYSVRKAPGDYDLEVWMRFEAPLGLGLLVQPMRTIDRVKEMFGAEDYKLGDPLFDETFLVRVSDTAGTVALLDADTRKRLLVIHDTVGPLSLTDDGISVRLPHVPPDPGIVPEIVRQMFAIARFIADKRRSQRAAGPYR